MFLALCPQVVSQASQHFRSSKQQAICVGCFARQSVCSVVSLHTGMSRAVHPQEFPKVDVDHRHIDWTVVVQPEPGRFRWGIDDLCLLCG